jgi:hypothetical protein
MFIGLFKLRNRIRNRGLELRMLAGNREVGILEDMLGQGEYRTVSRHGSKSIDFWEV